MIFTPHKFITNSVYPQQNKVFTLGNIVRTPEDSTTNSRYNNFKAENQASNKQEQQALPLERLIIEIAKITKQLPR